MPGYTKTLLCLANSYKTSGRCLAGVEVCQDGTLQWIRPVSAREHGEISEQERMYADGTDPRVGDILEIPLLRTSRHPFQSENHLIDPHRHWVFSRRAVERDIQRCQDDSGRPLWRNGSSSTYGKNDRVRENLAMPNEGSLRLIKVDQLEVRLELETNRYGSKRKLRGAFVHAGVQYVLGITDPQLRRRYFFGPDGRYQIGPAYLCISLGDPWDGFAYKLIATVILPQN